LDRETDHRKNVVLLSAKNGDCQPVDRFRFPFQVVLTAYCNDGEPFHIVDCGNIWINYQDLEFFNPRGHRADRTLKGGAENPK
jgi:hypothetical protein